MIDLKCFSRSKAGFLLLCMLVACARLNAQIVPNRVIDKIDEAKRVTIAGHIHPFAIPRNDRGPVSDDERLGHIILILKRSDEQQKALDARVDSLHNVHSENYHKWLTPEEFGREFGPSDHDVAAVASWLQSKGFTIEDMPRSKFQITFTGTAGEFRKAFLAPVHHLNVNGEGQEGVMNEPSVPATLAPVIFGFRQLHSFRPKPGHASPSAYRLDRKTGKLAKVNTPLATPAPGLTSITGGFEFYDVGPQDFYTIYNERPLLASGITGAGQTIAVIEESAIQNNSVDVNSFRSQFGLPAYPSTPNTTQGGVNWMYGGGSTDAACSAPPVLQSTNEETEAEIDVQWAGAIAPNAIVDFVACNTVDNAIGSTGIDIASQEIANYLYSSVSAASLSYYECENLLGPVAAAYFSGQWQQFAAEGITAVTIAGDDGSLSCDADGTVSFGPSASGIASSAYNVSVGGTDFSEAYQTEFYTTAPATTWWSNNNGFGLSSAQSYIPEITWGGRCSNGLIASYLEAIGDTAFGTTYTPEALCNNGYPAPVEGGGGGTSIFNALPTWQSVYGIGRNSTSKTHRNQPDISLFAALGPWGHVLPFCQSDLASFLTCDYSDGLDALFLAAGGTSFVAPQVAGVMALVNQATGSRQGQANYTLYSLASAEYGSPWFPNLTHLSSCSGSGRGANVSNDCIFHDIAADTPSLQGGTIASDIIEPCVVSLAAEGACYASNLQDQIGLSSVPSQASGPDHPVLAYYVGRGYDLGTGLGSLDITNLVNDWNRPVSRFFSTTWLGVGANAILPSSSLTLTATVTALGRGGTSPPAGQVKFYRDSIEGKPLGIGFLSPSCPSDGSPGVCTGIASVSVPGTAFRLGWNLLFAYFPGDGANDAPSLSEPQIVSVLRQY